MLTVKDVSALKEGQRVYASSTVYVERTYLYEVRQGRSNKLGYMVVSGKKVPMRFVNAQIACNKANELARG